MASDYSFVEFLLDGIEGECEMTTRKMFGEYALYCKGKTVALACDNQLFVKITEPGKLLVGESYEEGFPFPGAKPWILIQEKIENKSWLSELFLITHDALPEKKKKKAS